MQFDLKAPDTETLDIVLRGQAGAWAEGGLPAGWRLVLSQFGDVGFPACWFGETDVMGVRTNGSPDIKAAVSQGGENRNAIIVTFSRII